MPTIDQQRPDLSLDGQMRPNLSAALLELEVVVPAHGVSGMRARLGVLPGADVDQTFGWAGLSIGGRLVVTTQHAAAVAVFVGDITRVAEHYGDGPPTVTIVARDGLHRLDRAVRSRVFEDMTLADVVAAVAGEADLTSTVPNDDDERRWVQVGETDLQFLLRHVSERGLMLRLVDGLVTVRRMTPTGTGVVVSPATARRLELAADVAGASTAVTVAGWHLSEGVGVEQTAVPSAAPPGQHAAAEVLDGLGWPATRRLTRDMVGIDTRPSARHRRGLPPAVAPAGRGRRARRPQRRPRASGLGHRGVPAVRWTMDDHRRDPPIRLDCGLGDAGSVGARRMARGERGQEEADMSERPEWSGALHLARVLDDDDPEGRARLKVHLVGLDVEMWAPCLIPGGGPGYGAVLLPKAGEIVAVAFMGGEPDSPIVLGALWSGERQRPAAAGPAGGAYALITAAGGQVSVTDVPQPQAVLAAAGAARVVVTGGPDGSVVVERGTDRIRLEPSRIRISSSGTVEISASTATVSAASVTVNSAVTSVSGMLKCDSVKASTVIANSYTNGAGNTW